MRSTKYQADEILRRFKEYGIKPGDKYLTVYDALIGMLDVSGNRIAEIGAELAQCLTVHAKLNDECERLKEEVKDLQRQLAEVRG